MLFIPVIKTTFSASLLLSSVSHDPPEIIFMLICCSRKHLLLLLFLLLSSTFKTVEYFFQDFLMKIQRSAFIWNKKWKWCDMWPSMVTHTLNLCSAFIPSKCTLSSEHTHTHTHTHTPGAVGSHLCCGARGAVGGSGLAQGHISRGIEGGESAVYSLPIPTIPAGPETRTRDLWIMSPTLCTILEWFLENHVTEWC